MPVNRSALRSFLIENGVSESAADRAMDVIEDFFRQTESGRFAFGPKPDVDALKAAIAVATGRKTMGITFVSASEVVLGSGRVSDDACRDSLWGNLQESLGARLGLESRASVVKNLWDNLFITSLGDTSRGDSEGGLRVGLWSILRSSLGYNLQFSFGDVLGRNLQDSLFFYLGFLLAGDPDRAAELESLVSLMAVNPVFGEKRDEPGTWFVLTA